MWRHTSTLGLQPSRGRVPRVPWRCPVCPTDILFNPCRFTHKSGQGVPDVPGALKSPPPHTSEACQPANSIRCVLFIVSSLMVLGISCTCLRQFQPSFRQFQTSSAILVAICGHFEGPDGDPSEEVQEVQAKAKELSDIAQVFGASLFVLHAFWAVFSRAACKQFSVDASLWAICGQLSGVSCMRQASGINQAC